MGHTPQISSCARRRILPLSLVLLGFACGASVEPQTLSYLHLPEACFGLDVSGTRAYVAEADEMRERTVLVVTAGQLTHVPENWSVLPLDDFDGFPWDWAGDSER